MEMNYNTIATEEKIRPLANFPSSIWGDRFTSFTSDDSEFESYSEKCKDLKFMVRNMLKSSPDDLGKSVDLIDCVCRLGISYHFQEQIDGQLKHLFGTKQKVIENNDYDLRTVALIFRVFRQHGYKISSDVFNKFLDKDGKFMEGLKDDVKGMLSLYEACYLGTKGEEVVDEALTFTTSHLERLVNLVCPSLSKHISNSLNTPFHKGIPRLESRKYIDFYGEDEGRNEMLLVFAKLDFNYVQVLHQKELKHLCCWWKNLMLKDSLSYARDRLVEMYFWAVGVIFEPRYSRARMILTKKLVFLTLIDDTYDSYGLLNELEAFSEAFERWDTSVIENLPYYMQILYRVVVTGYEQFEEDAGSECGEGRLAHAIEEVKKVVRVYLTEARWCNQGYVPTYEEYMAIGRVNCGIDTMSSTAFIAMGEETGDQAYKWLDSDPKLVTIIETCGRLLNDTSTRKHENERHAFHSVSCYMKQYGTPKDEVIAMFKNYIKDGWKDINEELMHPTTVSPRLLTRVINFMRIFEVHYNNGVDKFTYTELTKDYISVLFINPVKV